MSDNFHIELRSAGRAHFDAAVKIGFANAPGGKATHYVCGLPERNCLTCSGSGKEYHWIGSGPLKERESIETPCKPCGGKGKTPATPAMVLLWSEDYCAGVKASPLPFPLTSESAPEFLWTYLQGTDFGNEPDHDGSNSKGYIVTSGDFWGHVEGSHYAFLAVYPDWQMHGK